MSVVTYKCPNCDGGLIFDPRTQQFACEYCLSQFSEEELKGVNPAAQSETVVEETADSGQIGAVIYSCPSCGAEVAVSDTTAATYCFYCHNPVVLSGRLEGELLPRKLIPFKISREEASDRFLNWAKKKWFVPKYFFSKKQIETMTGIYFPYWLVDCDVHGRMDARAEKVRVWRSGNTEYTEISHYRIHREGNIHFEDVIKAALRREDRRLVESVQPYDATDMIEFSMPYLSGFQAEKRDIEREDLQQEVANDVQSYSVQLLSDTVVGYSSVVPLDRDVKFLHENWDYTLLPVWVMTYRGSNGKIYYYAMNGQTGNVFGKLPINYGKLAAVCGGIFAALSALLWIVGWMI